MVQPRETRRSERLSALTASTSTSRSPEKTSAPRTEDTFAHSAPANTNTNGRTKRPSHTSANGRTKPKAKQKEIPSSFMDDLIESPTSKLSNSASVRTVEPQELNDAEDQVITRCICGMNDDSAEDGEFMIQCESCYVWQHSLCMGFESEAQLAPDADYYCEQCKPQCHYELFTRLAKQARESSISRFSRSPSPTRDDSLKEIVETDPRRPSVNGSVSGQGEVYDDDSNNQQKRKHGEDDTPPKKRTRSASVAPEELTPPPTKRSTGGGQSAETRSGSHSFPVPPDLTRDIIRINDQFSEVGGFGDVHKCVHNSASGAKEVAVKAFRFIFTLEERGAKVARMVRRELGIWKRLDHPNIVPFLGIATGFGLKGSTSIVSLWMSNGSLCQFLDSHGDELGVAHRLQMLLDVANGLDYLHSFSNTPVIHGDLNCNNVLVDANFTARLADFGLSSFVGSIPQGWTYLGGSTTRPGTLRWTAPEQLEDGYERAPQSDIYSFGCVSLQAFSGKPPWSEVREDAAVVLRLARGQKPQRPTLRAIEDRHWEFIESCWRPVWERPTAKMLVSSLQEHLSSCPPSQPLREMFAPLSSSG